MERLLLVSSLFLQAYQIQKSDNIFSSKFAPETSEDHIHIRFLVERLNSDRVKYKIELFYYEDYSKNLSITVLYECNPKAKNANLQITCPPNANGSSTVTTNSVNCAITEPDQTWIWMKADTTYLATAEYIGHTSCDFVPKESWKKLSHVNITLLDGDVGMIRVAQLLTYDQIMNPSV